jgi:hypothetical protein
MTEAGGVTPCSGARGWRAGISVARPRSISSGAEQLAREYLRHQAFRWGTSAYGFQFHLEAEAL